MINSLALIPIKAKRRLYQGKDPFKVLGVSPDASTREIKRAYLRLARDYHPDVNHSPQVRKLFLRINEAYAFIMKRGDLARLYLKCDMVEVKVEFVEMLHVFKRAKVLAGIEPEPSEPGASDLRDDERSRKMQRPAWYMMFNCLLCRWKDSCDRATGYAEVEEIHRELQSKATAKCFEGFLKRCQSPEFDKKTGLA